MPPAGIDRIPACHLPAPRKNGYEAASRNGDRQPLVNDHCNEFPGLAAIRDWAQREIIGDRVTMQPVEATTRGSGVAVTASIDGNFDKTGLPSPLLLTFCFTIDDGHIVQLGIVHNKPTV
jgi:hypothetical protein